MKTLNTCAAVLFVLVFLAEWLPTWYNPLTLPVAALLASMFVAPLYMMGLLLRWFVRGLVK